MLGLPEGCSASLLLQPVHSPLPRTVPASVLSRPAFATVSPGLSLGADGPLPSLPHGPPVAGPGPSQAAPDRHAFPPGRCSSARGEGAGAQRSAASARAPTGRGRSLALGGARDWAYPTTTPMSRRSGHCACRDHYLSATTPVVATICRAILVRFGLVAKTVPPQAPDVPSPPPPRPPPSLDPPHAAALLSPLDVHFSCDRPPCAAARHREGIAVPWDASLHVSGAGGFSRTVAPSRRRGPRRRSSPASTILYGECDAAGAADVPAPRQGFRSAGAAPCAGRITPQPAWKALTPVRLAPARLQACSPSLPARREEFPTLPFESPAARALLPSFLVGKGGNNRARSHTTRAADRRGQPPAIEAAAWPPRVDRVDPNRADALRDSAECAPKRFGDSAIR